MTGRSSDALPIEGAGPAANVRAKARMRACKGERMRSPPGRDLASALPSRVVHIDRLDLGIELDGGAALLARADAGGLGATERELRLAAGCPAVDVDDAGL